MNAQDKPCLNNMAMLQNQKGCGRQSSELRAQTSDGGGCCENVPHLFALHENASKNVPEVVFNDLDAPLNCRNVPFQSQIAGPDADLLSPDFSELSLFVPRL